MTRSHLGDAGVPPCTTLAIELHSTSDDILLLGLKKRWRSRIRSVGIYPGLTLIFVATTAMAWNPVEERWQRRSHGGNHRSVPSLRR